MPVNGPYVFKRAAKADVRGVIQDENDIAVDEWAWIEKLPGGDQSSRVLLIYLRDPDCKELCTLWYRLDGDVQRGHEIDAQGNVKPSVLHTWQYGEPKVERCGFHSSPTQLLDFVDLR